MSEDLAIRVIDELVNIVFSNVDDFTSYNGCTVRIRAMAEIDPKKLGAIREISQNKGKVSIKLYEKTAAIKLLGEHLGLFNEFNLAIAALRKYGIFLVLDTAGKWRVQETFEETILDQSEII